MTTDPTALPPERLGALLRRARRAAHLSRRRAAAAALLSKAELVAIERGWTPATRATVDALVATFGITIDQLIPVRAALQINGVRIATGAMAATARSIQRDDILRSYIELITNARDDGTLDELTLRRNDLAALSSSLDTDDSILIDRIIALTGCDANEAAAIGLLLRTFAGPILGVALSGVIIGGSIVASNTSGAALRPAGVASPTTAADVEIPIGQYGDSATTNPLPGVASTTGEASVLPTTGTPAPSVAGQPPHTNDAVVAGISTSTTGAAPLSVTSSTGPDTGVLPGETPTSIIHGG